MTKQLTVAMNAAMTEIGAVSMTGMNQEQKYRYASDEDLLRAVQPALARNGLALVPVAMSAEHHDIGKTQGGAPKIRCDLTIMYRLLHVSGESIDIAGYGQGWDFGDKAGYKAQTGALKYVLRTMFAIPVGNDPEQPSERRSAKDAAPRQARRETQSSGSSKPTAAAATSTAWAPLIAKVSANRGALQTLLAIWRTERDVATRDVALLACAKRFLDVTTTATEVANAIEWAEAAEDLRLPAAAKTLWSRALDDRIESETAAGEVAAELVETADNQ